MFSNAQWSGNVKKGVRLKLSDFGYVTKKAKPIDPKIREALLKAQLNGIAKTQKPPND